MLGSDGRRHTILGRKVDTYTTIELLEHLTKVVIPLQRYKTVPEHLPMNLPSRPTLPTLGTKAFDITDMDVLSTEQNTKL